MLPLLRKLQQVGADEEGFGCTLTASIARIQVGTPLLGTPHPFLVQLNEEEQKGANHEKC